jgi:endonuclease YncB( thermonuclease family)
MFLDKPCARHVPRFPAGGSTALRPPGWIFGLIFVIGIGIGTVMPGRERLPWSNSAAVPIPSVAKLSASPADPAQVNKNGYAGLRHSADVVRVIDGDTFEARVHLWPGLDMSTRVRLRGIDAPEMKSACAEEPRMAEAAGEALRALLADGDVVIFNIGPDKYNGRVVADAATRRTPSVAGALLASGHARQYQGGRRTGWCTAAVR